MFLNNFVLVSVINGMVINTMHFLTDLIADPSLSLSITHTQISFNLIIGCIDKVKCLCFVIIFQGFK